MAKKLLRIISLILVTTIFVGCSTNQVSVEPSESGSHVAPPKQIILFGMEDLTNFLDAVNLSDTELKFFLEENGYSINGVSSKDELESISELLNNGRFPFVKDAILTDITIFVDDGTVHVRYELPKGEAYSFMYSGDETLEKQQDALGIEEATKEWSCVSVSRSDLKVYERNRTIKFEDDVDNVHPYIISTSDFTASLRMFNISPGEIESYVELVSFGKVQK